jgi:hypothetical protein
LQIQGPEVLNLHGHQVICPLGKFFDYVRASKDGGAQIWDGLTAQCVQGITDAHGTAEATSVTFTKD